MDGLRAQITEAQKVRSDLMKWKLILVAGLGAAGLGFNKEVFEQQYLVLCFIPFVCVYVDALCAHLSLRITAVGEFLTSQTPQTSAEKFIRDYEHFLRISPPPFKLEELVLHWSTIILSVLVIISGIGFSSWSNSVQTSEAYGPSIILHCVSGIGGIMLTVWVKHYHGVRKKVLEHCAKSNVDA